jgi:hypothetical protein
MNDDIVVPGQLWSWVGSHHDDTWFLEPVTTEKRPSTKIIILSRGDRFIVVATDIGTTGNIANQIRWHMILLHGTLVWINHYCLKYAKHLE